MFRYWLRAPKSCTYSRVALKISIIPLFDFRILYPPSLDVRDTELQPDFLVAASKMYPRLQLDFDTPPSLPVIMEYRRSGSSSMASKTPGHIQNQPSMHGQTAREMGLLHSTVSCAMGMSTPVE